MRKRERKIMRKAHIMKPFESHLEKSNKTSSFNITIKICLILQYGMTQHICNPSVSSSHPKSEKYSNSLKPCI